MKPAFFGQYLLKEGIIDGAQLAKAVAFQEEANLGVGELARKNGILDEKQVQEITRLQMRENIYFGEAALRLGFLDESALEKILKQQRDQHVYLGDALVQLRFLTAQARDEALISFRKEESEEIPLISKWFPKEFQAQKPIIDEFAHCGIRILQRVGGIIAKYGKCECHKDVLLISPVAAALSFTDSQVQTLKKYIFMMSNEVGRVVAIKIYKKSGLALESIYKGGGLDVNEAVIEDVIAETANLICGQAVCRFSQGKDFIGKVPEKMSSKKADSRNYPLADGGKAARVSLYTPFGTVAFALIFSP